MSITGFLIILGCAVAGYWLVTSLMGPGIDISEEGRKAQARKSQPPAAARPQVIARPPGTVQPQATARPRLSAPGSASKPRVSESVMPDWYVVLDVSPDASRGEIQDAVKRRLAMAQAGGDTFAAERIARAAQAGLRSRG